MAPGRTVRGLAALFAALGVGAGLPAVARAADPAVPHCTFDGEHKVRIVEGCAYDSDAPPMVTYLQWRMQTRPGDGGSTVHYMPFRLEYPDGVTVRICGPGVLRSDARPYKDPEAVVAGEPRPDAVGCASTHYRNVIGDWMVEVATASPTATDFTVEITPD